MANCAAIRNATARDWPKADTTIRPYPSASRKDESESENLADDISHEDKTCDNDDATIKNTTIVENAESHQDLANSSESIRLENVHINLEDINLEVKQATLQSVQEKSSLEHDGTMFATMITENFGDGRHTERLEVDIVENENVTTSELPTSDDPPPKNETTLQPPAPVDPVPMRPQEDIPSFSEWTEKQIADQEKVKAMDENNTNVPTSNGKGLNMRRKNYASLDCGAKILATNPEAKSAGSVLSSSRDEYLLSACNSKIWFVVELCEALQLKMIELANFELFSSSPKEFSVYISDRFPSRDWILVGQFVANDVKTIQSFNLQPDHFTKYIKVEMHSHYGQEHYCPISLFRVYGTTEFEVLETVDVPEESAADDDPLDDMTEPIMAAGERRADGNILGSARDAVLNIVKKAARALAPRAPDTNAAHEQTTSYEDTHCVTLRYNVLCPQCDERFFNRLYRMISCYMKELQQLLQSDIIWKPIVKYNLCSTFGIFTLLSSARSPFSTTYFNLNEFYALRAMPQEMLAAFCNLIAIWENNMKQNATHGGMVLVNQTFNKSGDSDNETLHDTMLPFLDMSSILNDSSSSFKIVETSTFSLPTHEATEPLSTLIKPTKTLAADVPIVVEPSMVVVGANKPDAVVIVTDGLGLDLNNGETENLQTKLPKEIVDHEVHDDSSLDSLISELEKTEDSQPTTVSTSTPKPPIQKESVLVRLANRIKALERNMSLSGQYLDELSRRYKKQVEEIQRILLELAEDRKRNSEREAKRTQEFNLLVSRVASLTAVVEELVLERDSWSYRAKMAGEHGVIILLEIIICATIVCLCRGFPSVQITKRKISLEWRRPNRPSGDEKPSVPQRRQSLDDLDTNKGEKTTHKRRPSEEALRVDGSTHQDLLIYETHQSSRSEQRRRRRRQRRELLLRSSKNAINLETGVIGRAPPAVHAVPLSRSASASELEERNRLAPSFLRTATSARQERINGKVPLSPVMDRTEPESSPSTPSTPGKEKKLNGFRKMVKRFF